MCKSKQRVRVATAVGSLSFSYVLFFQIVRSFVSFAAPESTTLSVERRYGSVALFCSSFHSETSRSLSLSRQRFSLCLFRTSRHDTSSLSLFCLRQWRQRWQHQLPLRPLQRRLPRRPSITLLLSITMPRQSRPPPLSSAASSLGTPT